MAKITAIRPPIRPATSPTSAPVVTLPVWRVANRPITKNATSHTRTSMIVLSDPGESSEMMIWIAPSTAPQITPHFQMNAAPPRRTVPCSCIHVPFLFSYCILQ
ncbi:hypothetical protein [Ktedonobacter sp. SOSP1-52]|uniref:hypothetical protein n=1 Tax=Ktedonobacter sp. SOSP1-52 TaxID=2778366 RepID=UPI0019159C75|nr:hypothetical protein [Ktedonobacter sp. SOSP1-52]